MRRYKRIYYRRNHGELISFHLSWAWNNGFNFAIFLVWNEPGFWNDAWVTILNDPYGNLNVLERHILEIYLSQYPEVQKRIFSEIEKLSDYSYESIRDFKVSYSFQKKNDQWYYSIWTRV